MQKPNDPLREQLLGRIPSPADIGAYREIVTRQIERDQNSIKRKAIAAKIFWVFCAVSATAWLWFSAETAHLPRAPFLACIFFTWGGVEVVKHHIDRCRIDMLKEIKQL